ncbi:MAG: Rpn family recombination-promoting nuclease/putative transposase [Bacteroidales bacterium]|nr:Rpn family recombination-promoting nuclease/putative transposase [Bacteroidales bacterium]
MKNFQPVPDPEDLVFVDLLSDAGFKLVYANPENKSLLINLLNIVLPEFVRVSDIVEYRDREQTPESIFGKKTILDLVCKDSAGNIFSIEVQRKIDSEFGKRCVYYASGQYHSQLQRGQGYEELHPVFEIAFLEEQVPHKDEEYWNTDNIISRYHIAEMSTGERLDSTFFIIFAELGRFTKRAEECVTVKDRLFYWFKHASELKDAPMWAEEPELSALMTATQIAAFPPEKKETYI